MNADEHTRQWFDHGGLWHFFAGTYLGYRECGSGRCYAFCAAVGTELLLAWDWVRR